ncbi:unnamed protein product [Rotaria sordida]|uniref:Uncharacterized protein n=1 Tax=Rotaria sordida TaxID=392033 RepID=A0A819UJM0_9BILA|nr:unnamed protein product [Rotaria sordida]CAF4095958.1 unnamed protein product [Rotaria sordida]
MPMKKRKRCLTKSKVRRGVNKNKEFHFRATNNRDGISTRNNSMPRSNVVVADVVESSTSNKENLDCTKKRGANIKDLELEKKIDDDIEQNDLVSDTDSETGKLVIDEKCIEDETENETEKKIQKIFQVSFNRKKNTDCQLSSNELLNFSDTSNTSSSSSCRKKKYFDSSSEVTLEQVLRENVQLKKQIEEYQKNWIPKPKGDAASYLIELGQSLSNDTDCKEKQKQKQKQNKNNNKKIKKKTIKRICITLNLTKAQLKESKHHSDITKTCRTITKLIYPDVSTCAEMLVSTTPTQILHAIHEYVKLVHHQPKVSIHKLNNAIGNVFSAAKREQQRNP